MELFDVEVVDDLGEDETGEDDVGHNFTEGLFEAVLNDSRRYKKEYFNLIMCYLYFIMLPLYIHRRDLATCQLALVIVGGNKSGKEILFNNIIN